MNLDQQLFYFINTTCGNPVLDWLAPFWREKLAWLPFYAFLMAFFLVNFKKNGLLVLLALAATVGTADFVSSSLIKKNIQRLRPCNDPFFVENVQLRLPQCGGGWSFTSSHAANHFAAAVFLSLIFGRKPRWARPVLLGWATSISLVQVYVGVHYPADILGGAAVGILVGFIGYELGRQTNAIRAIF